MKPHAPVIHAISLPFLVTALLLSSGCGRAGRLDQKERNTRMVARAYAMMEQGNHDDAATLLAKALEVYPTMARPHLDLALLLHDRQRDYLRAVYHYQRYLELRPGSEKEAMIRERIRMAENTFVALRTQVEGGNGLSAHALLEENRLLRERIETLERAASSHQAELSALREAERNRLRSEVIGTQPVATQSTAGLSVEVVLPDIPERPGPDVARPAENPMAPVVPVTATTDQQPPVIEIPAGSPPAVQPPPEGESPLQRSYTVQQGDTLSGLAYKFYGDSSLWRILQEANRDMLGSTDQVRTGQVLRIPFR